MKFAGQQVVVARHGSAAGRTASARWIALDRGQRSPGSRRAAGRPCSRTIAQVAALHCEHVEVVGERAGRRAGAGRPSRAGPGVAASARSAAVKVRPGEELRPRAPARPAGPHDRGRRRRCRAATAAVLAYLLRAAVDAESGAASAARAPARRTCARRRWSTRRSGWSARRAALHGPARPGREHGTAREAGVLDCGVHLARRRLRRAASRFVMHPPECREPGGADQRLLSRIARADHGYGLSPDLCRSRHVRPLQYRMRVRCRATCRPRPASWSIGGGVGGAASPTTWPSSASATSCSSSAHELTSGSTFHSAGLVGQLRSDRHADPDEHVLASSCTARLQRGEHPPGWVESGGIRLASTPGTAGGDPPTGQLGAHVRPAAARDLAGRGGARCSR